MRILAFLLATLALATGCAAEAGKALTFSTWGSVEEVATLKPLLADFQREHPGRPIELLHIPDEYPHKIRLMAAARRMPDVLFVESQTLAGFARRGVFKDLGPFLGADKKLHRTDFFAPCLDALTYQGTLYAIPRDLSNLVIFYNRAMFAKAGVPTPKAGWTYEDMVATAKQLTHRGDAAHERWGIGFAPYPIYWLPYVWSDGADVMDPTMRHSRLMAPETLAALHRYLDLRTVHHVAPTEAEVGNARMSQLFAQGKLGMLVGGRWVVPGFRKKLDFDWDVAPFPRGKTGSVVDADASGWAIASTCQDPERAWALIGYLAGKRACEAFTASGLIVPARPDVAGSAAFLAGKPASGRVFLDAVKGSRPTLSPPSYDEIVWELIDGLAPAWNGEASLEDTLRPIDKRVEALLQEDAR